MRPGSRVRSSDEIERATESEHLGAKDPCGEDEPVAASRVKVDDRRRRAVGQVLQRCGTLTIGRPAGEPVLVGAGTADRGVVVLVAEHELVSPATAPEGLRSGSGPKDVAGVICLQRCRPRAADQRHMLVTDRNRTSDV